MREWVSSWESWGEDAGLPVTEEQRSENMDELNISILCYGERTFHLTLSITIQMKQGCYTSNRIKYKDIKQ